MAQLSLGLCWTASPEVNGHARSLQGSNQTHAMMSTTRNEMCY